MNENDFTLGAMYLRVSTDDQLEFSISAQKRAILLYAKQNNIYIDEEHIYVDEGISGKKASNRPEFMRMINNAKKQNFEIILIHKFDRFSRSREDSIVYKSLLKRECGIKVISITESLEDDKFSVILEAMLEAMAEYYSLNLADEVMKGMSEKAKKGGILSIAPYGYRLKDGKFVVDEYEATIVRRVFHLFLNEDYTAGKIAWQFNLEGITNLKGSTFKTRNIEYMLINPVYKGYTRWNYSSKKVKGRINAKEDWIIVKGKHEAIIDEETFEKVTNKIESKKLTKPDKKPLSSNYSHWLGGILRCANCGSTLTHSSTRGKYAQFSCNKFKKRACSTSQSFPVAKLEEAIIKSFTEQIENYSRDYIEINTSYLAPVAENLPNLELKLKQITAKLSRIQQAYIAGIDTIEEYKSHKEKLIAEEKIITKQIEKLNQPRPIDKKALYKQMTYTLDVITDPSATLEQKNKFAKSLFNKIVVNKQEGTLEFWYNV